MSDPNTSGGEGGDKKPEVKVTKVTIDRSPELEALRKEKDDALKAAGDKATALEAEKKALADEKAALEAEKKRISDELEEKKNVLAQQALAEFEKEKTAIMEMLKDSKLTDEQKAEIEEKLQTPKNLEVVKSLITMMADAIKPPASGGSGEGGEGAGAGDGGSKPPAPKGKAPFIPPTGAEQFEDKVAMVDELYRRAYYEPHLYTKEQVEEAKKKIDTLFQTLIGSKSWKQLKEGNEIPRHLVKMQACPKCGRTFIGELPPKCPTCGFNFTKTGNYQGLI